MDEIKPKVYMITNGTSPLGKAIALGLAGSGATVIMVARHNSSGEEAAKEIALATQNPNLELQLSDLANLSSVRNLAEIINSKFSKLDVLINNNSVYRKQRSVTVDGFEEMFAANYLAPNYDPTGSIALYHAKDIPPGLIRPEEDPTVEKDGVVKREQKA